MENQTQAEAIRVIEALGGTNAVAGIFGIKPPSVSEWKREGIPDARRQFLQLLRPDIFKDNNTDDAQSAAFNAETND